MIGYEVEVVCSEGRKEMMEGKRSFYSLLAVPDRHSLLLFARRVTEVYI